MQTKFWPRSFLAGSVLDVNQPPIDCWCDIEPKLPGNDAIQSDGVRLPQHRPVRVRAGENHDAQVVVSDLAAIVPEPDM